jgi:hypothetical protein
VVQARVDDLVEFLRKKRVHPKRYREATLKRRLALHSTAAAKLTSIFVNALAASGGRNLSKAGDSAERFSKLVSALREPSVDPATFLSCLGVNSSGNLFDFLQEFEDVGPKKAALFLRDIYVAQELGADMRPFCRPLLRESDLRIPFDAVIASVFNRLFRVRYFNSHHQVTSNSDDLTDWSLKVLPNDHMLFEDLWYWGYFCMKNQTSNGTYRRKFEMNRAKIFIDDVLLSCKPPINAFKEFVLLGQQWS